MFHRWPPPGNRDQVPFYLNQIAEGFLKKADKNKTINLEKEGFKKENIEGTEFYGEAVIITINGGLYQTIFMLSYGDGIWSDQFSGPKERWAEAVKILKKLKRKEYPVVVANGTGKFHYRI